MPMPEIKKIKPASAYPPEEGCYLRGSSSPIRIVRDETLQSPAIKGLYPAGEGAGYAGGIISTAVDGIKIAEAISSKALKST